jgi:DNA-binding SARP family transcriptional activator
MFEIRLFGTPTVCQNGEPLTIQRRSIRALLFYLAAAGTTVSRSLLSAFFWPDQAEENARKQLRQALTRLRAALPDGIIVTTSEGASLDYDLVHVDVVEFEAILHGVLDVPWKPRSETTIPLVVYQSLCRAMELWKPPGFLADVDLSFSQTLEDWRAEKNRNLEYGALRSLDRLADYELTLGAPEKAVRWLYHAIEIDNLSDDLHYRLLQVLLDAGMRHEARQHYKELERLFRRELGTEPSNAILSLKSRIFAATGALQANKPRWPLRQSLQSPFIGQRKILDDLQHYVRIGGGVIVFGEAGAGKTRLVQEFYQRINPAPRLFLASCHSMETNLPFHPWIELLRQGVTDEEWESLPSIWAAPLALLLPELTHIRPDLAAPSGVGFERSRTVLFESIHQLLLILSREGPVFIFLDDAHWADGSTLALLAYLFDQSFFSSRRGLLVMASRVETANPSLYQLLFSSPRQRIHRFELGQLDLDDVADLASHVLGEAPPRQFVERLLQDTGGNPFFLLETLQAVLGESGHPDLSTLIDLPLASSVHQLIHARLKALSAQAHEVLLAAAVQGSRFDIRILERVVDLPPEVLASALEELEHARLVQNGRRENDLEYTFIHEKIRESLLLDLNVARSRLLHLKIARTLEDFLGAYVAPQAAVIAQHFQEAGEFSKAFDYWVRAAQYAYHLASVQDATNDFARAGHLIARTPTLTDQQIYQLYSNWSDMAFENDDAETLFRLNHALLPIGQERGSDLLIGNAFDGLSDACMAANKFTDGLKYTEQAFPYLQRSGNLFELLETQNHRGVFYTMLGQFKDALVWFERSLELAKDSSDLFVVRSRGNANYQMGISHTLMGWPNEGLRYADRSLQDYTVARWTYGQVTAYSVMGLAHYLRVDYARGRDACLKGIEMAERVGGWRMLGYLHGYCGMNETELVHVDLAWHHAQKAIEIGQKYGHYEITALGYKVMGDIYARLMAYPQAAQMYQQGVAVAGDNFVALENLHRLGLMLVFMGQEIGRSYIQQAIEQAKAFDLLSISTYAEILKLSLLVLDGNDGLLESQVAYLKDEVARRSRADVTPSMDRLRAEMAYRKGDYDQALSLLEPIIAMLLKIPMLWVELRVQELIFQILHCQGRDATSSCERIRAILSQIAPTIRDAPLQPEWDSFCQKIENNLSK